MHRVSQASTLSICLYYFHLVRANPLNIEGWDRVNQCLYKLHKLIAQPSKHYFLLENIRIFHQSSSKADPFQPPPPSPFVNTPPPFLQDTPLLSSNKKVIMPPAQGPTHMNRERPGCLYFHNIQLLHVRLMKLCTPFILVINIRTMQKIVNYFRKMFHYRCSTGS